MTSAIDTNSVPKWFGRFWQTDTNVLKPNVIKSAGIKIIEVRRLMSSGEIH